MTSNGEVYEEDEKPAIAPLPFYPDLCKVLTGATLALVVTYLEIHHPPADDATRTPAGPSSAPIYVDCDSMCAALGVNRRTLHIALYCLCVWWKTEQQRSGAARAGREFSNIAHSRHGKVKPYSVVASRHYGANQTFTIRRNYQRINQILCQAHIDTWQEPDTQAVKIYPVERSGYPTTQVESDLASLLEKALQMGVRNGWTPDRRRAQSEKMVKVWEVRKKSG